MAIAQYTKAFTAALLAGLGSLQVALVDNEVTTVEWITVAIATISALGLVYAVPNTPAKPEEVDAEAYLLAEEVYEGAHADVPEEDYEVDDTGVIREQEEVK